MKFRSQMMNEYQDDDDDDDDDDNDDGGASCNSLVRERIVDDD